MSMNAAPSRSLIARFAAALGVLAAGALTLSTPAFANGVVGAFGEAGSGAGQLSSPGGVAVRQSSGDVYVVDRGNDRIEVFAADGAYVSTFGGVGSGAGQLSEPQGIAIEQLTGDVYVTDQGNHRVDEFEADGSFVRAFGWGVSDGASKLEVCTSSCRAGLAGGGAGQFGEAIGYPAVEEGSGDVLVADPSNLRVDEFTAGGGFVKAFGWGVLDGASKLEVCTSSCQAGVAGAGPGQFAPGSPTQLAVDASGNVYAIDGGNARVQKFDSAGGVVAVFASAYLSGQPTPTAIALEPTLGNILVAKTPPASSGLLREENGGLVSEEQVLQFDTIGDLVSADGQGSSLPGASAIAPASSGEAEYYASAGCDCVLILGPIALPAPIAETKPTTPIGSSEATLHGSVNPMETAPDTLKTIYKLQYSTGELSESGQEQWNTAGQGTLPAGASPIEVSASASGLLPNKSYEVRVVAEREFGAGTSISSVGSFTTLAEAPSIGGESVSNLGSIGVTVSAEISIGGIETTYHVQYGTSTAYGSETTTASTTVSRSVSVALSGLQPSTEYHCRFIATNVKGTVDGDDVTFTTYSPGISGLPDGRLYELVSPSDNHEGDVYEPSAEIGAQSSQNSERPFRAAADGDSVAYVGNPTIGGNGSSGIGLGNEYLATRSPQGGWSQVNISPAVFEAEYQAFSSDLTIGFVGTPTAPPFAVSEDPLEPQTAQERSSEVQVLYARAFTESDFRPLFTTVPDVPKKEFGLWAGAAFGYGEAERPVYAGSSADSSHVLFEADAALLEGDGEIELELSSTVEKEVQQMQQVAVMREEAGKLSGEEKHAKQAEALALEAVSHYRGELYMSVDGHLSLVNVSPEGKVVPNATFGGAYTGGVRSAPDFSHVISTDGSRVFWTSVEYVPSQQGELLVQPKEIYVREDGSRTVQVSRGPAQFQTASADGRFAYYTEAGILWRFDVESETREELAGSAGGVQGVIGTNETGEDGAYVYFVAQEALTNGKNPEGHEPVPGEDNLYIDESPEGPGASKIVFISTLSGADGGDWSAALGGRTATLTPDGQGLVFASHENLTGGSYPGEGSEEVYVFDANGSSLFCASCRPQASGGNLTATNTLTNTYRWISEDGDQVFFNSFAPLVSRDVNGAEDVYEWERDGSGACQEASGCVYLLSDGVDGWASMVDASANGSDLFFVARAALVPEGANESAKLYDARVDGALPVAPPQCTGTGCQGLPAPPPIFATPASVTFDGVGNFPPPPPVASVKSKTTPESVKCKKGYVKKKDQCVKKAKANKRTKKARKSINGKGSK